MEKRAFPRFPVNIPLNYTENNSQKTGSAQTHDISALGLCIITREKLAAGQRLDICLWMTDNGEQINRRGKVIWSDSFDYYKYKSGVQLEEPKLKPIELVLRTIKTQRKY